MTGTASRERSDADLIAAVRAGDNDAYGVLFGRHRAGALRLARQLLRDTESEDLVSEAFTKVLVQLQAGHGPDLAFRAYLLTAVRRLHIDRFRAMQRVQTTGDESELDRHVDFVDAPALSFERNTAADAFSSLPERWQLALWHLDVEGQKPADIAPLLGMTANAVSALAYRAREGLRQAYLQQHLSTAASADCQWTTARLGAHVRHGLSHREAARAEAHLDGCRRCMGIYLELAEVNSNLSGVLAPSILGAAATGFLASTAAAGAGGAAGAILGVKSALLNGTKSAIEPVKDAVASVGTQGVVATVAVIAVATTGVVAVVRSNGGGEQPRVRVPATSLPAGATTPTPAPTPMVDVPPAVTPAHDVHLPQKTAPGPPVATAPAANVPAPDTGGEPTSSPRPSPTFEPQPPAFAPTDFGIGPVTIRSDPMLLQRRITVPVTAQTNGIAQPWNVTLAVAFDHTVRFRGVVSPQWHCGALAPNTAIRTMTCTLHQDGPSVPSLLFLVQGLLPGATVSVGAVGNADPVTANNTERFQSGFWLLP